MLPEHRDRCPAGRGCMHCICQPDRRIYVYLVDASGHIGQMRSEPRSGSGDEATGLGCRSEAPACELPAEQQQQFRRRCRRRDGGG